MTWLAAVCRRLEETVWRPELNTLVGRRRRLLLTIRIIAVLLADLRDGEINMRATSLVYTTLVSLVPLLALGFFLLRAVGIDNTLRPLLIRFFQPLGSGSGEIVDRVMDFVQNVHVGVLGAIGVVTLLYSVLALIQKVEAGCNWIWQVDAARPLRRRVIEYTSVLIAAPLVMLAAATLTAAVNHNGTLAYLHTVQPLGTSLVVAGRILPYILYTAGFTLLFKFMPNTPVRLSAAFGGGLFSGVLWQTASLGFAVFAGHASNLNAIYSSFAILILLLIWLDLSWLILLGGCRVAFLLQHPDALRRAAIVPRLAGHERERLALLVAAVVAGRFRRGAASPTVPALADQLGAAPAQVAEVTAELVAHGVLLTTGAGEHALLPRRDIAAIPLNTVVDAVRAGAPEARARPHDDAVSAAVDALLAAAERARRGAYGEHSLADLAAAASPAETG